MGQHSCTMTVALTVRYENTFGKNCDSKGERKDHHSMIFPLLLSICVSTHVLQLIVSLAYKYSVRIMIFASRSSYLDPFLFNGSLSCAIIVLDDVLLSFGYTCKGLSRGHDWMCESFD